MGVQWVLFHLHLHLQLHHRVLRESLKPLKPAKPALKACWLGIAGRSPWPADGPRPVSTAGGRPQAALPLSS